MKNSILQTNTPFAKGLSIWNATSNSKLSYQILYGEDKKRNVRARGTVSKVEAVEEKDEAAVLLRRAHGEVFDRTLFDLVNSLVESFEFDWTKSASEYLFVCFLIFFFFLFCGFFCFFIFNS